MKISRLRVSELRQFRQPFELRDLQPGLNLFTGANEAGKSTLVRAIRAAFFERHRSTSVDDLRPYGDSAATPLVELDFEIAGTSHMLVKSFLQKKRCELQIGTRRLEGVDAEDHLAELLGFQFALKGASREEHWGIPGLLWIEQGSAQDVHGAVEHAADHLQRALNASLGEVAASGGDDVLARVTAMRAELLTNTGRPKATYSQAIEAATALASETAELEVAAQTHRDQVDQLRGLREQHAADAREQPWKDLRDRQAQAEEALKGIADLTRSLDAERENQRRASGMTELLRQHLAGADQQTKALATREAALAEAAARHEQAADLERQAVRDETGIAARFETARQALALARQENNRIVLTQQFEDARNRAAEAGALLERARQEQERAAGLRRDALALRVEPRDLKALREQQKRLRELEIEQAAIATRVGFHLAPGVCLALGEDTLSGEGERLVLQPTTLTIPGIGTLTIAPGGSDLADLAREHGQIADEHGAMLQKLGLSSLAEAEARDLSHQQRVAEAKAADKSLGLLVPKGLDALTADLEATQARHAEAGLALGRLPAAPETLPPALNVAERDFESAREAADQATKLLQQARQGLIAAASALQAATRERDTLLASLNDPLRRSELDAKRLDLAQAVSQEAAGKAVMEAMQLRIDASRPDILRQDFDRFKRSADEAERQHQARDRQILQLESILTTVGGQGRDEELATKKVALAHAERRRDELRRRAEALDLLLGRLDTRRQALTRRLQAPLQKHLDRYLQLLFPAGRLTVNENLTPGPLTRPRAGAMEMGEYNTLSFGAREQMGVISRLAYADLLKEAGRPTLVILDDALVHSDDERLAQMKRVLFDAAQRHQVLLFTCHPANWRDMGVPMRALATGQST